MLLQQEKQGLCVPSTSLARANAPASCSGKDSAVGPLLRKVNARAEHALAHFLERDVFAVRPDALEGPRKNGPALHVGLEMAVGTLVACDTVDQMLTCLWAPAWHSPADALVLAAHNPAFDIAGVS